MQIRVYDISGKILMEKEIVSNENKSIGISELSSGFYFMEIVNSNQATMATTKLVKLGVLL